VAKNRKGGKMVPITDEDIKKLKFIKEAAVTLNAMAEWTGFSQGALRRYFTAEEFEVQWSTLVRNKIHKVARELDPKPLPTAAKVPVFAGQHELYPLFRKAKALAAALKGENCEAAALGLMSDIAIRIVEDL